MRGLDAADAALAAAAAVRPSLWQRLVGPPPQPAGVAELREGYRMTLDGVDETLARFGVREVPALDEAFDPETMEAAAVVAAPPERVGLVREVLRRGYLRDGRPYRHAVVKVGGADPAKE